MKNLVLENHSAGKWRSYFICKTSSGKVSPLDPVHRDHLWQREAVCSVAAAHWTTWHLAWDCQQSCQLVLIVLVDSVNLITFSSHSYGFLLALLVDLMLSTVWEKTFMLTLHLCQIRWFNASNLLKTDACGLGVHGGK